MASLTSGKNDVLKTPLAGGHAHGTCGICMEPIRTRTIPCDETGAPVCDHRFCSRCLRRWCAMRDTCPLCRRPVTRLETRNCSDRCCSHESVINLRRNRLRSALRQLRNQSEKNLLLEQTLRCMAPQLAAAFYHDNIDNLADFMADFIEPSFEPTVAEV